jgi:uncharacterized membrane protein
VTEAGDIQDPAPARIAWLPLISALVALAGLADAIYLTVHHYTAEPVPCGAAFDCEMVLTSPYAEIAGLPLAVFGAAAYFVAFALSLLTAFGDRRMWKFFGAQVTLMFLFSAWLVYVQAFLIGAFCQFCLISAGTTSALLVLYIVSLFTGRSTAESV